MDKKYKRQHSDSFPVALWNVLDGSGYLILIVGGLAFFAVASAPMWFLAASADSLGDSVAFTSLVCIGIVTLLSAAVILPALIPAVAEALDLQHSQVADAKQRDEVARAAAEKVAEKEEQRFLIQSRQAKAAEVHAERRRNKALLKAWKAEQKQAV